MLIRLLAIVTPRPEELLVLELEVLVEDPELVELVVPGMHRDWPTVRV